MDKSQIWTLIATSKGEEFADSMTDKIMDSYKKRFVSFTKENPPEWEDLVRGCYFESVWAQAKADKYGTCLEFDAEPKGIFYLPLDPFQSAEAYYKDNGCEFLDGCLEVINYEE